MKISLEKTSAFGLVGYGFIAAVLLASFLPAQNKESGFAGFAEIFLNPGVILWAVPIIIFVPLNIWAPFKTRMKWMVLYIVLVGLFLSLLVLSEGLSSMKDCGVHPEYAFYSQAFYKYYLWVPFSLMFTVVGVGVALAARRWEKFIKLLDTAQRFILNFLVPLFSTILVFTWPGLLLRLFIFIPISWIIALIVFYKQKKSPPKIQ